MKPPKILYVVIDTKAKFCAGTDDTKKGAKKIKKRWGIHFKVFKYARTA